MAIPRGVTLICGGGFHGKSTLLQALEKGVYSHIEGDGRELVASSPSAVKIRAEDGRAVSSVDISAFINNLPRGKGTTDFSTPDASGSTSQAANIVEALEAGSDLLLIDEDSSATNFMIRDARMSQLIAADKEPITPFIARARQLWEEHGVSTIVVVGGAGDYFAVADLVIAIDEYVPENVTDRANAIVEAAGGRKAVVSEAATALLPPLSRFPVSGVELTGKLHVRDMHRVTQFDEVALNLTGVEQLVELGQTRAIVEALATIQKRIGGAPRRAAASSSASSGGRSLRSLLDDLELAMDRDGVDILKPGWCHNGLSRPRRFELAAALGRVRTAKFAQGARAVLGHGGSTAAASASSATGGAVWT
jgi:predicted ABC-class ATPase